MRRKRWFLGLSEGMKEHGSGKESQKGSCSVREVRFLHFLFSVSPIPFSSMDVLSLYLGGGEEETTAERRGGGDVQSMD